MKMAAALWAVLAQVSWMALVAGKESTWQSDLSSLTIGVSYEGFTKAVVDCSGDAVAAFVISMDEEFHGSVYTRGSYHKKNSECFRDADGGKDFALKFKYEDCGMKYDDASDSDVTTVIVQYDDDLIFPGDLAFHISCRRGQPDPPVEDSEEETEDERREMARITLVDADPGSSGPLVDTHQYYAASATLIAVLLPPHPVEHNEL